MKRCTKCREQKPFSDFFKQARHPTGYSPMCKVCHIESGKRSNQKNHDKVIKSRLAYQHRTRDLVSETKRLQGCSTCSEIEPCCLEFHHLDPNEKEGKVSSLARVSYKRFVEEARKCIVLCSNCHKKVHKNIIVLDEAFVAKRQAEQEVYFKEILQGFKVEWC